MAKTDLEKPGTTAIDIQKSRPEFLKEREGKEIRGLEEVGSDEMVLPRLTLTQGTTPQRQEANVSFIPNLKEGDFFNSLTKQIYGRRVVVMPLLFRKSRIYFKDINEGGGLICRAPHGNDCQLNAGGLCLHSRWQADGTPPACTEFYNYACLLYPSNEPIVVSLKVTGIRAGKEWNSKMRMRGADPFAGLYEIKSIQVPNKTRQLYWTYQIDNAVEDGGWVSNDQFQYNEKQYMLWSENLDTGKAKVDESTLSEEQFAMRDAAEM